MSAVVYISISRSEFVCKTSFFKHLNQSCCFVQRFVKEEWNALRYAELQEEIRKVEQPVSNKMQFGPESEFLAGDAAGAAGPGSNGAARNSCVAHPA